MDFSQNPFYFQSLPEEEMKISVRTITENSALTHILSLRNANTTINIPCGTTDPGDLIKDALKRCKNGVTGAVRSLQFIPAGDTVIITIHTNDMIIHYSTTFDEIEYEK